MKNLLIIAGLALLASCTHSSIKVQKMTLENPPAIGMVAEVGEIYLGGFSGLQKLDENRYLTLTDRGPN